MRNTLLRVVLITAGVAFLFYAARLTMQPVPKCERCGATLVPFQDDDRFYVCPDCGFMLDMERASEW